MTIVASHESAFVYDWRHRFGLSWFAAVDGGDWRETLALAAELAKDPGSHVTAAVNGWTHPWPAEAWVLANLYDLWTDRGTEPYPRPSAHARPMQLVGQDHIRAALAARGHRTIA